MTLNGGAALTIKVHHILRKLTERAALTIKVHHI